jgi:hypothetical protein
MNETSAGRMRAQHRSPQKWAVTLPRGINTSDAGFDMHVQHRSAKKRAQTFPRGIDHGKRHDKTAPR